MRYIVLVIIVLFFVNCNKNTEPETLIQGTYKGVFKTQDGQDIPFIFEVTSDTSLTIKNASERVEVNDIQYKNDSVFIQIPVFEGFISAKLENKIMKGNLITPSLKRSIPFESEPDSVRFHVVESPEFDISGNWETVFGPRSEDNGSNAKGIFTQNGAKVSGTFRTTTGDYRFLDGVMDGNQLKLSTFDGSHVFLFTGNVTNDSIQGTFYSGNHWKEDFVAWRNEDFELPDADSLTFLKPGNKTISFTFPDGEGNELSLDDPRFKDKVVLVQIMGTWCPNCLDESRFLAKYYQENKSKGLEIIALSFEYAKTEEAAFTNIRRLKENTGIDYPVLLAQYGSSSKNEANAKLPMLNHVLSYPTLIYIDKTGVVRKIHTGFNGPATGEKYAEFTSDLDNFVTELLNE
ncbi:TlpA disulfide reductase family protein [Gaetbulibacter sp. M240]|uniref:peroxiredoxin family protein n=1 Tax=Gaetbulibacter sp. M240 TaxID=3126511 RepID=UPI00374E563D